MKTIYEGKTYVLVDQNRVDRGQEDSVHDTKLPNAIKVVTHF